MNYLSLVLYGDTKINQTIKFYLSIHRYKGNAMRKTTQLPLLGKNIRITT